jgi:hypothetical protein
MDRAMDQAHALAAISAAFLGSLVDFVEALSIILAVGIIRGWMAAWVGAGAGLTAQAIIVAGLGPAVAAAPIHPPPFGMRWLRRAGDAARGRGDQDARRRRDPCPPGRAAVLGRAGAARRGRSAGRDHRVQGRAARGDRGRVHRRRNRGCRGMSLPASLGAPRAFAPVAAVGPIAHAPLRARQRCR